jgi:glycosyltransferase involved in cell wall biosynthesis
MSAQHPCLISVVVPLYNEAAGLERFHTALVKTVQRVSQDSYEIIYCDDGSTDATADLVRQWHKSSTNIKLIRLSRNFGKENALSAGIAAATGRAVLMIDGDGQHPTELIPGFIAKWQAGAQVVIGVSNDKKTGGIFRRLGSRFFYWLFNKLTGQQLIAGATDYRLIDKQVRQAFLQLPETDRITRGLIDWLGFRREIIVFTAKPRQDGSPGYSRRKLISLAANSFVSLTTMPLYLFGYLGVFITIISFVIGLSVFIEQLLLEDPLGWNFTGTAMLGILLLFFVGIVLVSQGMLALYISHIHSQSKRRPLFVIDYEASVGLSKQPND